MTCKLHLSLLQSKTLNSAMLQYNHHHIPKCFSQHQGFSDALGATAWVLRKARPGFLGSSPSNFFLQIWWFSKVMEILKASEMSQNWDEMKKIFIVFNRCIWVPTIVTQIHHYWVFSLRLCHAEWDKKNLKKVQFIKAIRNNSTRKNFKNDKFIVQIIYCTIFPF